MNACVCGKECVCGKQCGDPGSPTCALKALDNVKVALRAAYQAAADSNCGFVTQNCRLINRNTALEATVRELTAHIRSLSSVDEELCLRAEAVTQGLSDLAPSEQS